MADILPLPGLSKKSSEILGKKAFYWVGGIFCILLFMFLITILVLVIVDFTREDNLQSQMQPNTLLHTLRKGLDNYMGNDIILSNKLSFCFSKTYKLNPDTDLQLTDTLHNYFKKKFIEIIDPSEYLFNNQNKVYLNKGKIDIYYKENSNEKNTVIYSISSNLPYFSAIKLVHIGIDTSDQSFSIKHKYNLCTNEIKDEDRKCHRIIGKNIHHYNNTFNENIVKTDLYSTIHLLVFFINENDFSSNLNTLKETRKQQQQHKNLIGDIAFIVNLDKC